MDNASYLLSSDTNRAVDNDRSMSNMCEINDRADQSSET